MARLERLINLTAALLETERPLTPDELRARVPGYAEDGPAFRRAFERDKDALRELGVPVVVKEVDAADPGVVGYRIPKEDYYLADPGLEDDELAALNLAASAVRVEGADGIEGMWKLGGEVAGEAPVPPAASLPGATHLVVLFSAVSARRRVGFSYRGRRRELEPHRLSFRSGHWYLLAREPGADEPRWFRLDRISSDVDVFAESSSFDRIPPGDVAARHAPPWELGDGDAVDARLLIDASQAPWAMTQLGRAAVEELHPDGSAVFSVRVTNRDAFRSFVLGFLDHAEIIGPPDVRADMVAWLEALCR